MSRYVFIGNSTKPTEQELNDRSEIKLDNVARPCLKAALDMGYDVILGINRNRPEELRCSEIPIEFYDSHTYRSIIAFSDNKIAYRNLEKIVREGNVSVIHCNTPIGGMIGRLVGKKYHINKVIYTVHGFHFFKGAPLFNRTVLKWAEQIMALWTDAIITMNQEDYEIAQKFKLKKGGKVFLVHGVGITLSEFSNPGNRSKKREELGLKESDIAFISAGDLVVRKNYSMAIKAIAKANNKNIHYFICGKGSELAKLKKLAQEKGVDNQIHFLGFRVDIKELLYASDVFLFTTLQEGLPRSMMEAMACGLPCIASKIRGNVDLLDDGKGGFLRELTDVDGFADCISKMADSEEMRKQMSLYNLEAIKQYDLSVVEQEIDAIYKEVLGEFDE